MDIKQFKTIEIKFETADIVPPPFSHQILLRAEITPAGVQVDFQIAYIYREELTEEEIVEEGFTLNDDYAWKGTLHNGWVRPLQNLVQQTPTRYNDKALEESLNFLEINLNNQKSGRPHNIEDWEYLLQELMQAVYETAQKEAPFYLLYRKIGKDKHLQDVEINVFFAHRKAEVVAQNRTFPLDWDQAQELIQQVFIGEFLQESALKNEPKNGGKFITLGDGLWYEFGKSLKRPHENKGYLSDLEKLFDPWLV